MKICSIFIILSTICILSSPINTNSTVASSIDTKNLIKSICKIANDVTKSNTDTKDVLIGNLGGKISSSIVNDIVFCIKDETAVVVTDLNEHMSNKALRKAAVIILTFDKVDGKTASKLINSQKYSTIFHHMAKIICIAPSTSTIAQRLEALEVFLRFDHIDTAFVHQSSSGDVYYEVIKSLPLLGQLVKNPKTLSEVFPDKLKNLNGFYYKVPIYYQPPVVEVINNKVVSPMMFFLDAIGIAQNAKFNLIFMNNSTHLGYYWENRLMHLTINTAIAMRSKEPKLLTYDKKSYCALVPIPPNASYFSVIFVKPFDVLIWLLFMLSVVSSVVVWRMFRGHGAVDSHWNLAVGIFTMFIGQGAEFSRRNRFVLAFLLNIICLSVFLLSNLYEGAITSFMIEPSHQNRLKSVNELLNTNYDFSSYPLFEYTMRNSSLVQRMSKRLNSSGLLMGDEDERHIFEKRYAFIRTCDVALITLKEKVKNNRFVSDYYYLLPEELSWQYVQLEASYLNPFIDRFQYFMDLCFQAGLPYIWKIMASQDYSEFIKSQNRIEKEYLELQDLGSVFGVLIIGLGLSFFALLLEIFLHDCLMNLNLRKIWRTLVKVGRRMHQRNQKQNVRRIYVRP